MEDFSKLDTEDLIAAVKKIVDTAPIQTIKAQIDEAKGFMIEVIKLTK